MKTNIILQGDALTRLKELPNESINCVMTSPPYWALRNYDAEKYVVSFFDKKSERHHKDGNAKNNSTNNIMFLCRKHHQEIDGRMDNLKIGLIEIAKKRLKPYLEQTKLDFVTTKI